LQTAAKTGEIPLFFDHGRNESAEEGLLIESGQVIFVRLRSQMVVSRRRKTGDRAILAAPWAILCILEAEHSV
jgi:hypothetical protein